MGAVCKVNNRQVSSYDAVSLGWGAHGAVQVGNSARDNRAVCHACGAKVHQVTYPHAVTLGCCIDADVHEALRSAGGFAGDVQEKRCMASL